MSAAEPGGLAGKDAIGMPGDMGGDICFAKASLGTVVTEQEIGGLSGDEIVPILSLEVLAVELEEEVRMVLEFGFLAEGTCAFGRYC